MEKVQDSRAVRQARPRPEEAKEGSVSRTQKKELYGGGGLTGGQGINTQTCSPPEISGLCPPSACPNQKPQGKGAHWCSPRRTAPFLCLSLPALVCIKQTGHEWGVESVQHSGQGEAKGTEAEVCQRERKLS